MSKTTAGIILLIYGAFFVSLAVLVIIDGHRKYKQYGKKGILLASYILALAGVGLAYYYVRVLF